MTSAKPFDKRKLPSRHVTAGPSRAPHRSHDYAMRLTAERIHGNETGGTPHEVGHADN